MNSWIKRLRLDWRTFLSAALLSLCAPPFNLGPYVAWLALIPWFAALERTRTDREATLQGAWLGSAMSIGIFYWIAFVLAEFGHMPLILGILGLVLFSFIGEPQFVAVAALQRRALLSRRPSLLLIASFLYAGVDWVLPKLFQDTLGHSFHKTPSLRQVADIGGAPLLTFLVLVVNQSIWQFWVALRDRAQRPFRKVLPSTTIALVMVLVALIYGKYRLKEVHQWMEAPSAKIQAAMIQGNIGDFEKLAAERGVRAGAHKVLDTMFGLSQKALTLSPTPTLLVWPETAYPSTFRTPENPDEAMRDQQVERFTRESRVSLLFGGYDHQGGQDFNSFFFLTPEGALQTYHKSILLLFGEYIPGMDGGPLSFLKQYFPQIGNFGRGPGPQVFRIPSGNPAYPVIRINPLICYEALFAGFTLDAARQGSQAILNITNDSWFGPTSEPELHMALSAFRSIEARLPQLRSTNTGYTGLILPDGEITQRSTWFSPEVVNVALPIYPPLWSLMRAWGDWFGPLALSLGVIGFILALRRSRTR